MKQLRTIFRLLQINWILARYGLDEIIVTLHLFSPLRFIAYLNPWNWFRGQQISRGQRLRLALQALGPIFVKFGQALSTRPDLLPSDIAEELALLQDQVPPFSGELAAQIIENTFKQPLGELFAAFDTHSLASASIAQVHAAILKEGHDVVVKILRPGVLKMIERDVSVLYFIARLAERYLADGPRLRPVAVVTEFEKTLIDELDLKREAANASQLKRNFLHSPLLHVPEIYWKYCHEHILVMERIYGIRISDMEQLKARKVNLKKLSERGVEIFFTQVFRDSFFHADMHPGNIFINADDPENPKYMAVDFGIMGSLSEDDQRYLAENMLAFFKRDYRQVAKLHIESGWVPPNTPVVEFEAAIRTVCEPIFERPLKDISFAQTVMKLFQTARRFNMEVQPQLVLLQKTLFNIEGLGRQLYPELDLWSTGKPYLERWTKQRLGARAVLKKLRQSAPYWLDKLPEIPGLIYDNLQLQKHQHLLEQAQRKEKAYHCLFSKHFFVGLISGCIITLGVATLLGTIKIAGF